MLTILPIIIFFTLAVVILFLRRLERGTGYAWLAAVVFTLLVWGGVLALKWVSLPGLQLPPWRPYDTQSADQIVFAWDNVSWPIGFALVSLVLGLLFTAPARLQQRSNPLTWSANLSITGLGLLAVLATTPMATVLAWTMLDIAELALVSRLVNDRQITNQAVIAFSAKVVGSLLMLWAMVQAQGSGTPLVYGNVDPSVSVFLLLAAGLRLGVLPLNLPYVSEMPLQRGLSNTLRMTAQASSLAILARIQPGAISAVWVSILLPITALGTVYGAAMWATARTELEGRRFWSLALGGFAVASLLQGNPSAALMWGYTLVISGGIILFFSIRSKALLFIPILGIIGLTGLPFTPAAGGMAGLVAASFNFWDIFLLISLGLLTAGYLRLSLLPGEPTSELERWVFGVYPLGLILLAASGWLIGLLGMSGGLTPGVWWASSVAFFLAAGFFWMLRVIKPISFEVVDKQRTAVVIVQRVSRVFSNIFRLGWFYQILWTLFNGVQRLIELITQTLEGQGGVLWALLLVALLLTILVGGGFFG